MNDEQTKDTTDNSSSVVKSKDVNEQQICSINNINLLDERDVAKAKVFLTQMMRSSKGGIKSIEDGLAVIMRAQDLKIPFTGCLEHIHVIDGKTSVDIHIIKALLLKAGVIYELINDYTPLYEYTDGFNVYVEDKLPTFCIKCRNKKEAEEKAKVAEEESDDVVFVYPVSYFQGYDGNIYKSSQWNSALVIAYNQQHAMEIQKTGKIPVYRIPNQPVDYETRYRFKRFVNGHLITTDGHFSYSEAQVAGLTERGTYIKYCRILISHRAFTLGAREIASDILLGVMETTELKIVSGQELNDRDIIDIESEEIKLN